MNETEVYGSLKIIVNNNVASQVARDTILVEWMRHVVRHGLHDKYSPMMLAAIYY